MAVGISETSTGALGALPFQTFLNSTQTTNTNEAQQQQGWEQNRYTAQQQAGQAQGLSGLSGMVSGQTSAPMSMGLPQAVFDHARLEFNKGPAMMLAAQNGAGSPAIGSAWAQMLLGLEAESGKQAVSNTLAGYHDLLGYSFTPVGKDNGQTGAKQTTQQQVTNSTETGVDYGGLLGGISYALDRLSAGGFQQPATPFGGSGAAAGGSGSGWI